MTASPLAPAPEGAAGFRIFGKARLIVLFALLALLVLCLIFFWTTRSAMADLSFLRGQHGSQQSSVDLRPWQTAQSLAGQAVTAEENQYAREAEHLADHEVDQAFASALRLAALQTRHRILTGEALALSQKVAQLQQLITQDQALVQSLKARASGAPTTAKNAAASSTATDSLDVAQAQLGLDTDELTDAQRDLQRASGDESIRIQSELAAHEASMQKYDSQQQTDGQTAAVSVKGHGTLAGRLKAWFDQRGRYGLLQQALQEAQSDARALTAEHNALEAKANASAAAAASGGSTLAAIQDRAAERQILSIYDDRIQTDQQLASVYSKWSAQLLLQHRVLLHLILQSLAIIVSILIAMLLCTTLVRRLMAHPKLDRRQVEILRTIFEVGIQAVCVLFILLVIFGPPQQTTTMLGLATAALTITLQDYVLAFLGWFFLVGKHGIHVGDWVEINGVGGEVIEVGLMHTTLLETGSLADQGRPTGRRISFINSFAIRGQYFNFSTAGQWMWDEIKVSVPASENIHAVAKEIEEAAQEETAENARLAEQEWRRGARANRLSRLGAAPEVNLRPSGSGIDVQVRYVTRASERFEMRNRLYQHVIELLQEKNHPVEATEPGATGGK